MEKKINCRGIIFRDNQIAIMHRIRDDADYYVFPGGSMEDFDKSKEDCVIREVLEEFGINVRPIKQLYEYYYNNAIQYFYLCEWIDGTFGTGKGPEFFEYNRGKYIPALVEINKIKDINLKPDKITEQLFEDITKYGVSLSNQSIVIRDDL